MKVSLYRLPRSGWSFGRAGLGAKATYPAKVAPRVNNAVGIGLFPFITLVLVKNAHNALLVALLLCLFIKTIPSSNSPDYPHNSQHSHTN